MSMISLLAAIFLCLGIVPQQTPAPASAPVPVVRQETPKEDPAVSALALKIYGQMRAGTVDATLMTDAMAKALSSDVLAQTKPVFDQLGDPTKLTLESSEVRPEGTRWVYLAVFAMAQLHVDIFVTKDGKVGGYRLAP
jgi:hypothetical protein